MPFQIGFIDDETLTWTVLDSVVDITFACDIVLNFLTVYYDQEDNVVTSKKLICRKYTRGWFAIDTISILPFSHMLSFGKDYTSLARLARLPRLYKLIKITK